MRVASKATTRSSSSRSTRPRSRPVDHCLGLVGREPVRSSESATTNSLPPSGRFHAGGRRGDGRLQTRHRELGAGVGVNYVARGIEGSSSRWVFLPVRQTRDAPLASGQAADDDRPQDEETRLGKDTVETQVGEQRLKTVDSRGNTQKVRAVKTDVASIADGARDHRSDHRKRRREPVEPELRSAKHHHQRRNPRDLRGTGPRDLLPSDHQRAGRVRTTAVRAGCRSPRPRLREQRVCSPAAWRVGRCRRSRRSGQRVDDAAKRLCAPWV